MLNIGFFYQMWYTNQRAIFESFKLLRTIYPDSDLTLLVTGVSKDEVEKYNNNFVNIIKDKFNINKVDYFYLEDYKWNWDGSRTQDELLKYNHDLLDKMVEMPNENVDIMVFGSEDWHLFKEIPITGEYGVGAKLRDWDGWMREEMKQKFDYSVNYRIPWFQHGHYMNLKTFKQKYTQENKDYIINTLKELYPTHQLFSDYVHSVWNTFVFDKIENAQYILDLPSEISEETPFESFEKYDCVSRHGYKMYYTQPPSEEMIELGIKPYYE